MNKFRSYLLQIAIALCVVTATACTPTQTHRGTGETIDDASITARVKVALANAKGINAHAINVNTYRGEVQLSGFLDQPEQISRAVEIARGTPGVRGVTNSLTPAPKR